MRLSSVTFYESGQRTVNVTCTGCGQVHEILWPSGCDRLREGLPCGFYADITIPTWARNPRRDRTHYRFDPSRPHTVAAGEDRDDAAIDVPVPNWEE